MKRVDVERHADFLESCGDQITPVFLREYAALLKSREDAKAVAIADCGIEYIGIVPTPHGYETMCCATNMQVPLFTHPPAESGEVINDVDQEQVA
jgi:hypothetical protein